MVTHFRCSEVVKVPLPSRDNQVRWHAETIMTIICILKSTMSSVVACLQKATMSSSTFWRRQCIQSLHAFKRRQCPHLHFKDDNVFSHCMLSKGDNDLHLHFEDDNVFSHCMPSKAIMTIICISKTIMSSVITCLQRRQRPSFAFRRRQCLHLKKFNIFCPYAS